MAETTKIDLGVGGAGDAAGSAPEYFDAGNAGGSQAAGKFRGQLFGGKGINRGRQRRTCSKAAFRLRPAAKGCNGITLGVRLDDRERALADGAGGTEDC